MPEIAGAVQDMVLGVSIAPREEDRAQATLEVLQELLSETGIDRIADVLITQQQIVIQAKRLEKKSVSLLNGKRATP